jgi:hypothetical protein
MWRCATVAQLVAQIQQKNQKEKRGLELALDMG